MKYIKIDSERCKGCELCIEVCPKKVIAVSHESLNKLGCYPAYAAEPEKCIGCMFCAQQCPDCAITVYEREE